MKSAWANYLRAGFVAVLVPIVAGCGGGGGNGGSDGGGSTEPIVLSANCDTGLVVGAYYYPWWGEDAYSGAHTFDRTMRAHLVPVPQNPRLGHYDSRSDAIIADHIDQSLRAGVDFWAESWWGPDTSEDVTLREHVLTHPRSGEVCHAIHYESQGRFGDFADPDFSILIPDFRHLAEHYFAHPAYLTVDGKPVVIIYLTRAYFNDDEGRQAIADLRTTIRDEFGIELYLVGDDVFGPVNPMRAVLWDAVTDFDIYGTVLHSSGSTTNALNELATFFDNVIADLDPLDVAFIPSASPGFNDKGVRDGHPAAPRYLDGETSTKGELFKVMLEDVVVPRVDPEANKMLLVNSFNEWHEDTQIEASVVTNSTSQDDTGSSEITEGHEYEGYGNLYLDTLAAATE